MLPLIFALGIGCSLTPAPEPVNIVFGVRGEGEIEPCGCPENPRGGLSRRAHTVHEHRAKGPLVVVDGGVSLSRPTPISTMSGDLEQRRIKAGLIAQSYADTGIDGMALGASDWFLGRSFVQELVAEHELPVLAANLTCDGAAPYPGATVVEAGGKRIGVVGVTTGEVEGCEVGDARAAVAKALAELGPVDVTIGLFPYVSDGELAQFTTGDPLPVDIAVDARTRATSSGAERRAGIQFLSGGVEGKSVGVLGLRFVKAGTPWVASDGIEKLEGEMGLLTEQRDAVQERLSGATGSDKDRFQDQLVAFDNEIDRVKAELADAKETLGGNWFSVEQLDLMPEVPDHEPTKAMVEAGKDRVAMAGGEDPAKFVPRMVAEGPYLGGEGCVSCHEPQHLQWSRTGHARAWQGLVAVNRALDGACWSCHVTGAGQEGGPQEPSQNPGFRDVQCEACHGPGRAHAGAPTPDNIVRDPGEAVCVACHDGVRDEGRFDYATYRPKIVHPSPNEAADAAPSETP